MEITPTLEFYDRIAHAGSIEEAEEIRLELKRVIINNEIESQTEIMLLSLAIDIKVNSYRLEELEEELTNPMNGATIIVGGNEMLDQLMDQLEGTGVDREAEQLEEFYQEEVEDFENGNVVSMREFKGRKDDRGSE